MADLNTRTQAIGERKAYKAVLRKVRGMREWNIRWLNVVGASTVEPCSELIDWLLERSRRYNKSKGGLQGRKRKAAPRSA